MKKYAIISLSNKENIGYLCSVLKKNNIYMIASGKTSQEIKKMGYLCNQLSDYTQNKEILDGRIKTLNSSLYASILYNRNNATHKKEIARLKFPNIEFVIVNFYPFKKKYLSSNIKKNLVDLIDIGGPTLLRSAAKNYKYITAISDIDDYEILEKELKKNNSKTTLKFRKLMAAKVFEKTSTYDNYIANWMSSKKNNAFIFDKDNKKKLRYGENHHQKSFVYTQSADENYFDCMIQGKILGYNNILDIDSALNCIKDFGKYTCVIIKHNNPCGISSNINKYKSFLMARKTDPISAFGGVVIFNFVVDEKLAKMIVKNFFEIVIALNFTQKAINILRKREKLILIKSKNIKMGNNVEIKSINSGYLVQEINRIKITKKNLSCVSGVKVNDKRIEDLIFGFMVCKHVKSNAIVLIKNKSTVGIGAGQMSRIDATKIALNKKDKKIKNFIAASDAFFPFIDNVDLLYKNNCKGIIQPSGSINDSKIIKFCSDKKIPLYFTSYRFFKH